MTIEKNKVVTLHYSLRKNDSNGELVEETFGNDPLVFLYGAGQMIPKFEEELKGKSPGDSFEFGIKKEEAYGDPDPKAVITLPKSAFVVEGELASDLLVVGNKIPMRDQEGRPLMGVVKEVQEDNVIMDFNHPMAGVDLHFSGKIEDVRAASQEELEHGHAHGPGGHQHQE